MFSHIKPQRLELLLCLVSRTEVFLAVFRFFSPCLLAFITQLAPVTWECPSAS